MSDRNRVVIVASDDATANRLAGALADEFQAVRLPAAAAIDAIHSGERNVCIADASSANGRIGDIARAVREAGAAELIVLANGADKPRALEAVSEGAFCFVLHPVDPQQVNVLVSRAAERARARTQTVQVAAPAAASIPEREHAADAPASSGFVPPAGVTLEEIERATIYEALKRTRGNKQAAANALGIYRPRLYSKIKKYNMTEFM